MKTRIETAVDVATYVLGVGLTLFTVHYAHTLYWDERREFANLFLGFGLALFFLTEVQKYYDGDSTETDVDVDRVWHTGLFDTPQVAHRVRSALQRIGPVYSVVAAVTSIAVTGYVHYHYDRLAMDALVSGYTTVDVIIGLVIVLLVTDATRRAFGNLLTSVVVFSVAYAYLGSVLSRLRVPVLDVALVPEIFHHTGMTVEQIARHGAIGLSGAYGFILQIGATWVAIFIMFAGLAKAYGALDYVLSIGEEMGNSLRSGVVQIAVIASMIMGSITGSAAANTATTGSFTIPMIKEQGVSKDFAAAIESVASSGGQMLPPVMGVAAFLMADILGVEYVEIVKAGIIPAVIFYFSVGTAVYLVVLKYGWTTENTSSFDFRVFLKGVHFVIPLGVLVYTLVFLRFTPLSAGKYTMFSIIPVMFVRNVVVGDNWLEQFVETLWQTVDGFRQGAVDMAPLVGILASLGVILEMVTQTGLSQKISLQMVSLAGGVLVLLLVMAMVASILFGLGMPTPAAYILVAMLVVPGVIEMGVPEITAHMFVFYFAMLSAITPPVAVAVAIGSSIAGSDFLRSCMQALRVGAPGFVIPFAFVTNNSLIYWAFPDTLFAFPVVLLGTVALVMATTGFDGTNDLNAPHRLLYVALAAGLLFGPFMVQVATAVVTVLLMVVSNTRQLPAVLTDNERPPDERA